MTGDVHTIDIDRVIVTGVTAGQLDAAEIRALVTDALTRAAADGLPARRLTIRPAVRFSDITVAPTATGVASAVTTAVTSAVLGGGSHG